MRCSKVDSKNSNQPPKVIYSFTMLYLYTIKNSIYHFVLSVDLMKAHFLKVISPKLFIRDISIFFLIFFMQNSKQISHLFVESLRIIFPQSKHIFDMATSVVAPNEVHARLSEIAFRVPPRHAKPEILHGLRYEINHLLTLSAILCV